MKHKTLELSAELVRQIGHRKEIGRCCFERRINRIKEWWVESGIYRKRWSYSVGGNMAPYKNRNKLVPI